MRFARSGITTSGLSLRRTITIASTREGRTGVVLAAETDDDSLKAAVKRSEEYAAVAPVNQERVEPLGPQKYPEMDAYDEQTASARGAVFVNQIRPILERARKDNLLAAGLFSRTTTRAAIANKAGNRRLRPHRRRPSQHHPEASRRVEFRLGRPAVAPHFGDQRCRAGRTRRR